MSLSKIVVLSAFALGLTACGNSLSDGVAEKTAAAANVVSDAVKTPDTQYSDAPSGVYTNEKTHAYITFVYDHQGFSNPYLRWRNWDSTLNWDSENPENSSVSVTIDINSIDSGVDVFDGHLRGEKWFDVAQFPEATFQSTALTKTSEHTGVMTGDLSMKGMTKPVTLDVRFNKAAEGRGEGTYKIGFSAKTEILRSDWGLGAYAPSVSDEVTVIIEAEYIMGPK